MTESTKQQQFQNNGHTIETTINPGCQVRFDITITPEATAKAHKKAVKEVSKQVVMPGFRKGKAPAALVTEKYGSQVNKQWRETLFDIAFQKAVTTSQTFPYSQKSIQNGKIETLDLTNGATLWVEFEAMPQIPEFNAGAITLKRVTPETIHDTKIDQVIEDLRYQHCEWETIEGGNISEGDFIDIDIKNLEENGGMLAQDTRVEVAAGKLGRWLLNLLLGKKVGESVEGISELDETGNPDTFTPTRCQVTIKGHYRASLPPLDDELAKKCGVENAELLKQRIREDLENVEAEKAHHQTLEQLKKTVIETYRFEVPESMVKENAGRLISSRKRQIENTSDDSKAQQEALEQLKEKSYSEVTDFLRWKFFITQIINEQKIKANEQEVIKEMIHMQVTGQVSPKSDEEHAALYEEIHSRVLETKATNYLLNLL